MRLKNEIPKLSERAFSRFWEKVLILGNDECWEWKGRLNVGGYGVFDIGDKGFVAHRVSYYLANKVDAVMLCVCHRCDNPKCVNPNHLFLGTDKDNYEDMRQKGRAIFGGDNFFKAPKVYGENHGKSKFTEEEAKSIVSMYEEGGLTYKEISEIYNCHLSTIAYLVNGKTWGHLKRAV